MPNREKNSRQSTRRQCPGLVSFFFYQNSKKSSLSLWWLLFLHKQRNWFLISFVCLFVLFLLKDIGIYGTRLTLWRNVLPWRRRCYCVCRRSWWQSHPVNFFFTHSFIESHHFWVVCVHFSNNLITNITFLFFQLCHWRLFYQSFICPLSWLGWSILSLSFIGSS